jgi:hypothetical protein
MAREGLRVTLMVSVALLPLAIPLGVLLLVLGLSAVSTEGARLSEGLGRSWRRGGSVVACQLVATSGAMMPLVLGVALWATFLLPEALSGAADPASALALGGVIMVSGTVLAGLIYIAFVFAPQLAIERELSPGAALLESLRMVSKAPLAVAALVLINVSLQLMAAPTVVALIPVTAFVNTARGAAYRQLLEGASPLLADDR